MIFVVTKFVLGLALLLVSTNYLIKIAKEISSFFRISPLIVGFTLVAIGTSLPELAVSITSIAKQDPDLALANIVGSNIVNTLLVFPTGILIGKMRIGTTKTQRNNLILLLITAAFFYVFKNNISAITGGLTLISLSIVISFVEYLFGINGQKKEDSKKTYSKKKLKLSTLSILTLLLTIGLLIIASNTIIEAVEQISYLTNISTTILGLTLTAIATSLPELLTTIISQEKHQEKLTLGNVLGSNIYNLTLIGGIIILFSGKNITLVKEQYWLIGSTLILSFIIYHYRGKQPPKIIALVLYLLFFVYLTNL